MRGKLEGLGPYRQNAKKRISATRKSRGKRRRGAKFFRAKVVSSRGGWVTDNLNCIVGREGKTRDRQLEGREKRTRGNL